MYKRREAAIAELVANAWDAGSREVDVHVPNPDEYNPDRSVITITDCGRGMTETQVQDEYLVVARNRRARGEDTVVETRSLEKDDSPKRSRPVMGRKGIGKLAGFGLARKINIKTWTAQGIVEFDLDVDSLEAQDDEIVNVVVPARLSGPGGGPPSSGTIVTLSQLKHKAPLDKAKLEESLARRFSRRVQGQMRISVNGVALPDATPELRERVPPEPGVLLDELLPDGHVVRYWYGFALKAIGSRDLRGFAVLVRGRTAQAPPFFFDDTWQHTTRYVVGDIEADFLDSDPKSEDVISTDRQEIDWDDERVAALRKWGETLTRKALAECAKRMGEDIHNAVLEDPEMKRRLAALDSPSREQAERFLKALGRNREEFDDRTRELADYVVRAFEYQSFHDVIGEMEAVLNEDPAKLEEFLDHLGKWSVLESRAIKEIVSGRLFVIDRYRSMILNNAPETAPRIGVGNMHDLLAEFPWLLEPRWTLVNEERNVTTEIRRWDETANAGGGLGERYDFLALENESQMVVLEIKRPGHAVAFEEIQRLETYQEKLAKGTQKKVNAVLIYGGSLDVTEMKRKELEKRETLSLVLWQELFERSKAYFESYRDVLEGRPLSSQAQARAAELRSIRDVKETGQIYRGPDRRRKGTGPSA
jgi:hypothetical protein